MAEHAHSFKETPEIGCPDCEGSVMFKLIGCPGIAVKHSHVARRLKDRHVKETEMRQDMLENHMVEKITPMAGQSIEQVYKEVKASGSGTKEAIQRTIERNEAAAKVKQKNWQIGANKRVEKRTIEKRDKQAAEAAKNRAISVSTKK